MVQTTETKESTAGLLAFVINTSGGIVQAVTFFSDFFPSFQQELQQQFQKQASKVDTQLDEYNSANARLTRDCIKETCGRNMVEGKQPLNVDKETATFLTKQVCKIDAARDIYQFNQERKSKFNSAAKGPDQTPNQTPKPFKP